MSHYSNIHSCPVLQGVEELIAYWTLESSEDTLEELEETLIVSQAPEHGTHCMHADIPQLLKLRTVVM